MKPTPPLPPEPADGRKYWRSLDQLTETAEFQQWMEREFPEGATEWHDPVSRRHFVKIMSASFLLAGLGLAGSGCRRPEEKVMPFAVQPEGYVHGQPQYYATAMPTRTGAIPLVVKAQEGRPVKIEGNDKFPGGHRGTDRYAQASILNLYDPDRATRFVKNGQTVTRTEALDFLEELARKFAGNRGAGLAFLIEPRTSPSFHRLRQVLQQKLPESQWFLHEPVDTAPVNVAATAAFDAEAPLIHDQWGHTRRPRYRLDKAARILALDCDFLGDEDESHTLIRDFAQGRKLSGPTDAMSRLYVVESLMTLTGAQADHRLRTPASRVAAVTARMAVEILKLTPPAGVDVAALTQRFAAAADAAEGDAKWIAACARDLVEHKGRAVVLAGHRQPIAVQWLAHAMNAALGAVGQTLELYPALSSGANPADRLLPLFSLAKWLNDGKADTLVILGGNPVFTAAADLDWAKTQRQARTVIRLGYYEDETAAAKLCDWHFPLAHYLESWGDARTHDGTLVPVQPLIQPLFGGLTELEFLARLAGETPANPHEIVRETFRREARPGNFEEEWKQFLYDGFRADSAPKPVESPFAWAKCRPETKAPETLSKERLEVIFHRDYSLDDGRYANNGWLQELPDPITKMVWDNAVLLSRQTARELGVKNGEVVEVSLNGRSVKGPVWIQPGMADYSLGLALGYGRERAGRVGNRVGFNAYPLRSRETPHFAVGATVRPTGKTYPLACTQDHWSMEGRPIVREANLEQFQKDPGFAKRLNMHEPPGGMRPLYPNPLEEKKQKAHHQWGMSIDLNTCVGCSACVIACQSENNIPIVGKDQVKRGREMHWLRIDRYYASDPARQKDKSVWRREGRQQFESWIDDPQTVMQPMMCQHCESAPCENVCPVNATVHDEEGLNVMAYNRCVGTRYCSNNCPYKVRRFNYFDYNKRPINALYLGPLGKRKDDEWDLIKMLKNPDVTVRMRGVMEKCTFCIQRIEQAKIAQKVKARDSGDVVVPDGTFTTACAQACPADAIVFGNIADPASRVSQLKRQERDYTVMEYLNIRPRTTYLARVRNPNPAMPDYPAIPATLSEYATKSGDPSLHSPADAAPGEH